MKRVDLNKWERYFEHRNLGVGVEAAAKKARIASSTAYRFERGDQSSTGIEAANILGITHVGGNLVDQPLSPEALRSLDDFAYFRLRYMGRKSTPWQERAAYDVLRSIETPDREYLVVNMPPGAGKSTLFTHDIPCWLIARNRGIRVMIGARTERQARMYVGRIKRTLERDAPVRASSDALDAGHAWDAVATMQDDFGAFRPEGRSDLWRAEALVVRQLDGVATDDKEPTVAAYGQDSGFLGGRFDFIVWDDLVDSKNTRNSDSKDSLREWWGTEAETRLEPGGALLLQGQRIGHDDLYRYALDMKNMDDEPKYRHIIYRAHDEDLCSGNHDDVKPWPEGCLLDPYRLPWKVLETVRRNSPRVFDVQYQQNDGEYVGGLFEEVWIKGGTDEDGYICPGCLDKERVMGEVPEFLQEFENVYSFVTVDPSPTEWWGIIWWVYEPITGNRYVIDIIRRRMNPEDFLSLNLDTMEFTGLIPELRHRAMSMRVPIWDVIVEVNAAQRWLISQPHVQRYMAETGIVFLPHQTTLNKRDPQFGFESTGDLFRQGKVRLPYLGVTTKMKVKDLLDEGYNYPDHDTDDLLMSTWFAKLAVENWRGPRNRLSRQRPGLNPEASRGLAAYSY